MPRFLKNTPNLLVADVERSLAFYEGVLGFERQMTVPDEAPFVFVSVVSGPLEIFLNQTAFAVEHDASLVGQTTATRANSLFIEVEGVDDLYQHIQGRAPVVMPIITQWYGMREFAISDPDGFMILFAERVASPGGHE